MEALEMQPESPAPKSGIEEPPSEHAEDFPKPAAANQPSYFSMPSIPDASPDFKEKEDVLSESVEEAQVDSTEGNNVIIPMPPKPARPVRVGAASRPSRRRSRGGNSDAQAGMKRKVIKINLAGFREPEDFRQDGQRNFPEAAGKNAIDLPTPAEAEPTSYYYDRLREQQLLQEEPAKEWAVKQTPPKPQQVSTAPIPNPAPHEPDPLGADIADLGQKPAGLGGKGITAALMMVLGLAAGAGAMYFFGSSFSAEQKMAALRGQWDYLKKELEQTQANLLALKEDAEKHRQAMQKPPGQPQAISLAGGIMLFWEPGEGGRSYHLYRGKGKEPEYKKITTEPLRQNFIYLKKLAPGTWHFAVSALSEGRETGMGPVLTLRR
jgi:hypothetical protein